MTINSLSPVQSTPVVGLATQTFNIVTDGFYTCQVRFTIPYRASGMPGGSDITTGGSSLQILVKQGATTRLTLANPTPTQPSMSGSVVMQCVAGDVITVVPSSAAAADNELNAVKGIINLFFGE